MSYGGNYFQLRTAEFLGSIQSKLSDAEKTIKDAMLIRQDIAGILTRLDSLKKVARSSNKSAAQITQLERGIMGFIDDESEKIFSIIEHDMLLFHDLTEYLHELMNINHEMKKEKAAQSTVKLDIPDINNEQEARKAEKHIEATKRKIERVTEEGQKLVEIKRAAAESIRDIKIKGKDMKKTLVRFRNQFDAMARTELKHL